MFLSFFFSLLLLNKLLEDGNSLYRQDKLPEACYRYEYALKRIRSTYEETMDTNEVFKRLESHLLLNLSRALRKQGQFQMAVEKASKVLELIEGVQEVRLEAFWARAKARVDMAMVKGDNLATLDAKTILDRVATLDGDEQNDETTENEVCDNMTTLNGEADDDKMATMNTLEMALSDLREAIKIQPQNLKIHRLTIKVKETLESKC